MHHLDAVLTGEAFDGLGVLLTDLPEGRRRWNPEAPLPAQERAHLPDCLQLGHVPLQEDPVQRPALEGHVIPQ
jgi:hypothetical protein